MRRPTILKSSGLLLAVLLSSLLAIAMPKAAGAEGFNLTISPLPQSLTAKPGQTISTPLKVQNTGTDSVKLKVSLMKFKANGQTGEPIIEAGSAKDTYLKWASFSKTSFVAEPNVLNTVDMTIKIPKDAAFGYYYAAVFSQDNGNGPKVPNQSRITGAVASLILLDVQAPGEKRQLQVVSFTTSKKVYQYLPATFNITVKNVGNIHAVPSGNIFIGRPGSSNFIDTLSVNEPQGNILPNSQRVFTTEWDDGFPSYQVQRQNGQILSDKSGQPIKKLSWDLKNASKLRLGHYTASMTLVYNDGTRDIPINGKVSFWVIPWIPFLIILLLLGLMGVGLFVLLRPLLRRVKRLRKKEVKA